MTQFFRRIKIDVNDTLYSKIIRFGVERCQRCNERKTLQCAHIVGRASKSTRFLLEPVKNAIPLCATCHSWFDQHKDNTPVFDELARRYFSLAQNSYVFLFRSCGYSWTDLQKLIIWGKKPSSGYKYVKSEITLQLKEHLKRLEAT